MRSSAANVVVSALKRATDSDDIIVRLYEAHGAWTRATLTFGLPVAEVAEVDLLEEHPRALDVAENGVQLTLRPFQVVTLRVRLVR